MGGTTGQGLIASCLGALQASISVILTLFYGFVAARLGLVNERSARDVSKLCVNMFLPALVIVNVGSQLDTGNIHKYVPVFIWSLVYTSASMLYGKFAEKVFKLPSWTSAACSFNNTTSLPLLLVESLADTGFLDSIAGGDVSGTVEKARSFFLINSMVSNALTFAVGPKLLSEHVGEPEESDNDNSNIGGGEAGDGEESADEHTSLMPDRLHKPVHRASKQTRNKAHQLFEGLPKPVQSILNLLYSFVNPPSIAALIAIIAGLTPFLHKAFFDSPQNGGVFKAWLTSSIKKVGELFTVLQMFIVGAKLSASLDAQIKVKQRYKSSSSSRGDINNNEEEENDIREEAGYVPKTAMLVIFLLRFAIWPVISIFVICTLAHKTFVLSEDPILWFSMILIPTGPPAILMSSLAELSGSRKDKMSVARLLTISYAITPVVSFTVVGAVKGCEWVLERKS